MQAPTTPSGSPDRGPGERTCPNCGAANGLTAAFCWQCYQPFGAYRQPPGLAGSPPDRGPWTAGVPTSPPAWTPRTPQTPVRARRGVGGITGVVLLTVAVIVAAYLWVGRDGSVSLPASFGSVSKIENEQTGMIVDAFDRQLGTMGVEGDLAMYGNGLPTAALVWIRDAAAPTTDAAFDRFASGFDAGFGAGSLDGSRKTIETRDGITYVCAPLASEVAGTICMWQDRRVFWLLFDFSGGPFEAGRDLAEGAHRAVA